MDARLKTIMVTIGALGFCLGALGMAIFSPLAGFSVWVGSGVATANLYALARLVAILVPSDERRKPAPGGTAAWLVVGLLKMGILFGGVWTLLRFHIVEVVPLFVGLACLPIGIAIGSIVSDRRAEATDGDSAPRDAA